MEDMSSTGGDALASGGADDFFAPPPPPSNNDYRHARWHRPARLWHLGGAVSRARQRDASPVLPVDPRRVVIVGVCSSGKSTLKESLRAKGYIAEICAQEHSGVPYLWQRLDPDVLIYLDASLSSIRQRGRRYWQQSSLDTEHGRLDHARRHCHLYVQTDGLSPHDVAARALTFLHSSRIMEEREAG